MWGCLNIVSGWTVSDWRRRAPRWSAAFLACLTVADLGHLAWAFRSLPTAHSPSGGLASPVPSTRARADVQQIVNAHLFGVGEAARQLDSEHAPETQLALALTGVIATKDPNDGYAILGEKGKATHLYRTGASLSEGPPGRLYQVFDDHVVLDLNGRLETLRLPRHLESIAAAPAPIRVAAADTPAPADRPDDTQFKPPRDPTMAESWFDNLRATRNNLAGQLHGMRLHPNKRFEREFDLREGDVVTAVNGVEITDADALRALLKGAPKTLSLTFTRAGAQQTLTVPIQE